MTIVPSFYFSSIYKNNNSTIFTKSAVHNESNRASEKKESRNGDANKSVTIVKINFDKKINLF